VKLFAFTLKAVGGGKVELCMKVLKGKLFELLDSGGDVCEARDVGKTDR
jgi:hypothetical protein